MASTQPPPNPDQMKKEAFRRYIEVEVLKVIQELVLAGKLSQEKVNAIAHTTLELIKPQMSLEELYQNAVKLDDTHSELAPVVFKIMKEYEETYEKKALSSVSELVKSGNFDQAQDMVKKVLKFKISN